MNYEKRFVAFLDIIGFKEWIKKTQNDETAFKTIKECMDYISEIRDECYKHSSAYINKEVTVFSDSIVISYSNNDRGALFFVLIDLIYICINLNAKGIFVRGSITYGELYHKNYECFGPAMVEAYYLEQYAIFPRIILYKETLENGIRNHGYANTTQQEEVYIFSLLEKSDFESFYYLDYLSQYQEMDSNEDYMYFIYKVRKYIIANLEENRKHPKVYEKYYWFAKYFNHTICKLLDNASLEYNELIISKF